MTLDALISPDYRQEQIRLHTDPRGYGGRGRKWATFVNALIWVHECQSVLDYGCGEGSLGVHLALAGRCKDIRQYDPAVPGFEALPEPADLVVCTDVLEHVEADKIDAVLDHLCGLTQKVLFVVVSLIETAKTLSDGRQAHILLKDPTWWHAQFTQRGLMTIEQPHIKPEKQWCAVLQRKAAYDAL